MLCEIYVLIFIAGGLTPAVFSRQIDEHNTGIHEQNGEEAVYAACDSKLEDVAHDWIQAPADERPSVLETQKNWRTECLTFRRVWDLISSPDGAKWEEFWHDEHLAYIELPHLARTERRYWTREIPELHTLFTAADIAYSGAHSLRILNGPKTFPAKLDHVPTDDIDAIVERCDFSDAYVKQYVKRARSSQLATPEYVRLMLTTACKIVRETPEILEAEMLNKLAQKSDEYVMRTTM